MKYFLVIMSGALAIVAVVPYILEIVRGNVKPRIVTWLIWTILTGIACIASFAEGQAPSAILTLIMTLQTGTVVVLLLLKGASRKIEKLDAWCLTGAALGLVLWPIFNSPTITIVAMITIDAVGAVPTVLHAWQKPHEEKWVTFALTGLAGLITLGAAGSWEVSAIAYPVYLLLLYVTLVSVIFISPRRRKVEKPQELDLI